MRKRLPLLLIITSCWWPAFAQIGNVIHDIRGDTAAAPEGAIVDTKDGLLQRVDKVVAGLDKVK